MSKTPAPSDNDVHLKVLSLIGPNGLSVCRVVGQNLVLKHGSPLYFFCYFA